MLSGLSGRPPRLLLQGVAAAALAVAVPATVIALNPTVTATRPAEEAYQAALRTAVAASGSAELTTVYSTRDYAPVWIKSGKPTPEAGRLVRLLEASAGEGLAPADYETPALSAELRRLESGGSPAEAAVAEIALSKSYAAYLRDRRRSVASEPITFVDAELAPRGDLLAVALSKPDPLDLPPGNRLYEDLKGALAKHRAAPAALGDLSAADVEALLLVNLDRTRGLPSSFDPRHLLVDVAAGELRIYEGGRQRDRMKVVVGQPSMPTPSMAGLIRYAAVDPYWYVPPDLTRDRFARRAAADPAVLHRLGLETLSDWTPGATPIAPNQVDWESVAAGRTLARLRQKPGPGNPMGRVKFMLPNTLGIYLHDTPEKELFQRPIRTASAGCIRVEDADRVARWLLDQGLGPPGEAERIINLQTPTPVFILYITARIENGRLSFNPDVYRRDGPAIERLRALGRLDVQRS